MVGTMNQIFDNARTTASTGCKYLQTYVGGLRTTGSCWSGRKWRIFLFCLLINPATFYGFCFISYMCVDCGLRRGPGRESTCTEAIFWEPSNTSYLSKAVAFIPTPLSCVSDEQLHRQCHVFDDITAASVSAGVADAARQIAEQFTSNDNVPNIRTKCGVVKPKLVSWKQYRTSKLTTDNGTLLAPNIVHYVLVGTSRFTFLNYMSFLSADRFIRPTFIFLHGDIVPTGHWWERTLREVPNVYHVYRERTVLIQNRKPRWVQHSSDILRLQAILDNGGIYLDTDIAVVRSFDALRQYDVTLGRETHYGLGNGIIVGRPLAPFTCVWLQCYRDYTPWLWNWARFSIWTPEHLSHSLPSHLLHVELDTLQRPNWAEVDQLFLRLIDWRQKYALHIWKKPEYLPTSPEQLAGMNNTVGEVFRMLYYDRDPFFVNNDNQTLPSSTTISPLSAVLPI